MKKKEYELLIKHYGKALAIANIIIYEQEIQIKEYSKNYQQSELSSVIIVLFVFSCGIIFGSVLL